jgi:hypothetical protein
MHMETQLRSVRGPRGVQIEDVWGAADVVLNRGERPTIERIRQQLGRGSPNTVGPMLDSWYATLARRLKPEAASGTNTGAAMLGLPVDREDASDLPAPVLRAAKTLWGRAQQLAEEAARTAFEVHQASLADAQSRLAAEKDVFEGEKQRFAERASALEAALFAKDQQILQSGRQLEELKHMLHVKTEEAELLRSDLSKQRIAMDAMRQFTQAKDEEHRKERERLEQRATAQEHRLLTEIDRARQAARQAELQLETSQKQSTRLLADAEERCTHLEEKLSGFHEENATLLKNLFQTRELLEQQKAQPIEPAVSDSGATRSMRLRAKAPVIPKKTRLKR